MDVDSILFCLRSPTLTIAQQNPNSTSSSSRFPDIPEVDHFVFDEFISDFSPPTHKDESDTVQRPGEPSMSTSLYSERLDPFNSISDAHTLEIQSRLPVWRGNDHRFPVAHRPPSVAPDATASKKEPKKRAPVSKSSDSHRRRATRAPYSSADQRKKKLEEDDYVSEIIEEECQVLCAGCEHRINLDKRGRLYLQNWTSHRKRCRGVKDGIVSCQFHCIPLFLIFPAPLLRPVCDDLK